MSTAGLNAPADMMRSVMEYGKLARGSTGREAVSLTHCVKTYLQPLSDAAH